MKNKKYTIIGISGSILIDEGGMFSGYERAYVNNDYIQSLVRCKAILYIVPMIDDEELIRQQVINIDALILSGGQDINPLLWNEEPHNKLGMIMPKRDTFDSKLFKIALELKKPVLGICRGEQIINVVERGSLYQDISLIENAYVKHNQQCLPNIATHTVEIKEGTKLYEILKEKEVRVNSFHHLCVKNIAPGYIVSATAKDGVAEAIEKVGEDFVIGVQWHPEMMTKDCPKMKKIFMALVNAASE